MSKEAGRRGKGGAGRVERGREKEKSKERGRVRRGNSGATSNHARPTVEQAHSLIPI